MNDKKDYLQDLAEIRSIMEKSTRFISLSGLSGVFAGIFALIGAGIAHWLINDFFNQLHTENNTKTFGELLLSIELKLLLTALSVLFLALLSAYFFSSRKAKKLQQKIWTKSSKLTLINVGAPLCTGGLFCIVLFHYQFIGLIAPSMLIFYGLALINGSKFTLDDIRVLGYMEIILGFIACFFIGHGILFWALGFGALHIIYGISMYYKYEYKK